MKVHTKVQWAVVWMLWLSAVAAWADDSIGLEFPVIDAKEAVAAHRYEFAGIDLPEGIELPGLSGLQIEAVKTRYKIRLLNQRSLSYTNIEDKPQELVRMRGYAVRYNRTMWKAVKEQELKETKKYRY